MLPTAAPMAMYCGTILMIVVASTVVAVVAASFQGRKQRGEVARQLAASGDFTAHQQFVGADGETGLGVDTERRKLNLVWREGPIVRRRLVEYRDLLGVELCEDGVQVGSRGTQLMGAAIGGALLGPLGALAGSLYGSSVTSKVRQLDLRFLVNDTDHPHHTVMFHGGRAVDRNGPAHRAALSLAEHWLGLIEVLMRQAASGVSAPAPVSQAPLLSGVWANPDEGLDQRHAASPTLASASRSAIDERRKPAPPSGDHRDSEILQGYRFHATLQIRTPLAVLDHHDELFRGRPEQAPNYADMADGIWLPQVKPFSELGISGGEISPGKSASDIGPVIAADYLPFLRAFRAIVESGDDIKANVTAIKRLRALHPKVWAKVLRAYPDFPHSFFYAELTSLPGIGPKTARNLYEAGLRTVSEVLNAGDEQLRAVAGVGPGLVAKLRAAAGEATPSPDPAG